MCSRRVLLAVLVVGLFPELLPAQGDMHPPSSCAAPATNQGNKKVTLVTGQKEGYYYKFGKALAKSDKLGGLEIDVRESHGSDQNIQALAKGEAHFAVVQSDVAHWAWPPHPHYGESGEQITLVSPLYTEVVHVLLKPHLHISSMAELRRRRGWLGLPRSGSEHTAKEVLEAAGLTASEVKEIGNPGQHVSNFDQASKELGEGKLEVVLRTVAQGAADIQKAVKDSEIGLVGLDPLVVERLEEHEGYVPTWIPARIYSTEADILTAGVQALLLAGPCTHGDAVETLAKILHNPQEQSLIEESMKPVKLNLLKARFGSKGAFNEQLRRHVHPRAENYLPHEKIQDAWIYLVALLLSLLAVSAFLYMKRPRLRQWMANNARELAMACAALVVWLTCAVLFYDQESERNPDFNSLARSTWSAFRYLAGLGGEITLSSKTGKSIASFGSPFKYLLFSGVILQIWNKWIRPGFTTGWTAWWEDRKVAHMDLHNHIVIINWDSRTNDMIRQLHSPDLHMHRPIVVVSQSRVEFPPETGFERVVPIQGDPAGTSCLTQAVVQKAHSVSILSAWQPADPSDRRKKLDPDVSDGKTIMTILKIRSLCADQHPARQVPITAEIRAEKNRDEAENAGRGGETEIVCLEDFGIEILTQCAATPGLAKLYKQLLTFARDKSEIYRTKVPENCVGKPFAELMQYFASLRGTDGKSIIPIGVYRAPELFLNPREDRLGTLRQDDFLFVIAEYEPPLGVL